MIVRKSTVDPIEFGGLRILDYTADARLSSSLATIEVPPGAGHPQAWSRLSDKFYLVTQGKIEFAVGDETAILSKGDFCFVRQGRSFSYENKSAAPAALVLTHTPAFDLASEVFGPAPNVRQAVPFFGVTDIEASLRFYVDGLGFSVKKKWTPEGRIRWCWIELGGVAVMLQEYWKDGRPGGAPTVPLGQGASVCFMCADAVAIYRGALERGLAPAKPFVGNALWVTSFTDPDGYHLDFESPTDVPEGTEYAE